MPGPPRIYASNAARQRAYRERQRRPAAEPPAGLPALPRGDRVRWRALVQQAQARLATAAAEMREYHEQRSDAWRDSERGESFLERLEAVEEAEQAVEDLDL